MKKLMIAACAVAFAAAAQAATVQWNSGTFTDLPDCPSSTSQGGWGVGTAECVQMMVWTFTEAGWNTDYQDGAKLWDAYQKGSLGAATTGISDSLFGEVTVTTDTFINTGKAYGEGDKVYAAILFLHNEEGAFDKPDYYMANYALGAEASELGGTFYNLGNTINGDGGATVWTQAVPEPTSGLLLLLGVAGLALRRRRA